MSINAEAILEASVINPVFTEIRYHASYTYDLPSGFHGNEKAVILLMASLN